MAISGSVSGVGILPVPQLPYSVSRGTVWTFSFKGLSDLSQLFPTTGISATTPANFGDMTVTHTHGVNSVFRLQATAQSDGTWTGSWGDAATPGVSGWTAGLHLWWMIFVQPTVPSGTDVPDLIFDLGVILA